MDEELGRSPTWHAMQWMMFHGLSDFASSPSQNWETTTLEYLTTVDSL